MILKGAAVYSWTDDDGTVRTSNSPPDETADNDVKFVDTADTVLSLTGIEAVELGLAGLAPIKASELGNALGLEGWVLANQYVYISTLFDIYFHNPPPFYEDVAPGPFSKPRVPERNVGGVTIVAEAPTGGKTNQQRHSLNRNFRKKLRDVAEIIRSIEQSDPEMGRYEYSEDGELTPSSVTRWKEREVISIGLWKRLFHEFLRGSISIRAPWIELEWWGSDRPPTRRGDPPEAVRMIWRMRNIR